MTRLHGVTPALPDQVSVVLRTTIADELVVTNPTSTPLVVLDPDGAEFLRVSASGVQGNEASPYFHLTAVPPDVRIPVPPSAQSGAAPAWVPLSAAPTWAFFDPRMSPANLQVPVGGRREIEEVEQLAAWSVPLRYRDQPVSVEGALERRPVTGRFETSLDPAPAGVSAVVAQGYVPSISVQAAPGREVAVLGRDGRPFLRFGPEGAQLDRGSPTHRDDVLARGRPLASDETGWIPLPGSGTTWADVRLRFPRRGPAGRARRRDGAGRGRALGDPGGRRRRPPGAVRHDPVVAQRAGRRQFVVDDGWARRRGRAARRRRCRARAAQPPDGRGGRGRRAGPGGAARA